MRSDGCPVSLAELLERILLILDQGVAAPSACPCAVPARNGSTGPRRRAD